MMPFINLTEINIPFELYEIMNENENLILAGGKLFFFIYDFIFFFFFDRCCGRYPPEKKSERL